MIGFTYEPELLPVIIAIYVHDMKSATHRQDQHINNKTVLLIIRINLST